MAEQNLPLRELSRSVTSLGENGFAYLEELAQHKLLLGAFDDRWRKVVWLGRAVNTEWNAGHQTEDFPNGAGLPFGIPGSQFAVGFSGETNILTIGSAGAGKNAAAIMPTLLLNQESVFVNDIKGENWWVTHAWREREFGQRIICLNPFNLFGEELGFERPMTNHYNPLAALADGNHPKFGQRISGLANALIVAEGKEPHWSSRARDVVSCLMAIVATSADEQRAGTNHLPRVMDLLSLPHASRYQMNGDKPALDASGQPILLKQGLADYVAAALKWCKLPVVVNNAEFILEGGKEFASIISTAKGQLSFLNDPALQAFLSKSDFDFSDLRKERCTIYLMIPPAEMQTYFRFARVLVQACLDTLSASPMNERDSVLVILDEQAKLRGMEVIETSAATLRGYNVRIWSVYQDVNQIKRDYEKSWETFVANAGTVQILSVNDDTKAEYFSKKAGDVGVFAHTWENGEGRRLGENLQRDRFLPPQAFYGMNKAKSVNFVQGLRFPVVCDRQGYFESEVFFRRWLPLPDHDGQGGQVAWELMRNTTAETRERQHRRIEGDKLGIPQGVPLDDARMEFYRGRGGNCPA
jgi:type IV secretion system protein VirD4